MADEKQSEHQDRASELVAKAWADETFKQRLISNPVAVLKEHGFPMPPEGVEVRVVENTDTVRYLVLPSQPKSSDLETQGYALGVTQPNLQALRLQTLKRAAVGAFAERAVCALWSPARVL